MSTKPSYRPDIDGLRAVAVLSVVLYHYGATWLPGGFTGVDVFFVISGYLITTILRREIEEERFSLVAFYDRRIRRIVPALLVVLFATMVAGWFLLMPGDYAELGESAAFSAAGFGNLFFYWNTGYFDQAAEMHPLLHMWSLGVEEQYYFVWPLALLGLMSLLRKPGTVLAVVAGISILGLAYASWLVSVAPKDAFYLPIPRAWELLAGSLLAFAPTITARRLGLAISVTGIALVGCSLGLVSSQMAFPGLTAVPAVVGAALLIWPKPHNPIATALSSRPFVAVGLISYSLYLWHWPVLVLYRHYNNGLMPELAPATFLAVLSALLAYLSWRFIERPFRKPMKVSALVPGLAAVSIAALAGYGLSAFGGFASRVPTTVQGMRSLEAMWQWNCPQAVQAFEGTYCAFGDDWESAKTRVALWGDSHAEHFAPIFQQILPDETSVLLLRGCIPIVDNVTIGRYAPDIPTYSEACAAENARLLSIFPNERIDMVILAAAWSGYQNELYDPAAPEQRDPATSASLITKGLSSLLDEMRNNSIETIVVADVPQRTADPVPCAIGALSPLWRKACEPSQLNTSRTIFENTSRLTYDAIVNAVSAAPDAMAILPGDKLCNETMCLSQINGEALYRDATHLRRNLAESTMAAIADMLDLQTAFGL